MGQLPDLMHYGGVKYPLLSSIPIAPTEHIDLVLPEIAQFNWPKYSGGAYERGYFAEWKLEDDFLWLMSVHGIYELKNSKPELADWVTQDIVIAIDVDGGIADGTCLDDDGMNLIAKIECGNLINVSLKFAGDM